MPDAVIERLNGWYDADENVGLRKDMRRKNIKLPVGNSNKKTQLVAVPSKKNPARPMG